MKVIKVLLIMSLVSFFSGCGINNIPTYDEAAQAAWGQVINQYKRRADLIPNLVNTVKGYASHEEKVFVEVTNARAKTGQMNIDASSLNDPAMLAKFEEAQSQLSSALSKMMLVSERYPELKASQNFLQLQSQLEGAENRISVARRDFIAAVQTYNTELRTFPGRLWHSFLYSDLKEKAQFTVPDVKAVEQAPDVSF